MLIQKGFLLRSLGNVTSQARNRFFQPISPPESGTLQRSRLFNILLLVELGLFLIALPTTFLLSNATRLFSATIVLFAGSALSYAVGKSGRYNLAAWVNLGGVGLGLLYYNLRRFPDISLLAYLDFRASSVLVVLPVLLAGTVVSTRICLAITGVSLVFLLGLGLGTVPYNPFLNVDHLAFYSQLFRVPLALVLVVCLSTIVFERNVLQQSTRLCKRHLSLKAVAARLDAEVENSERLLNTIGEVLARLEETLEEHQTLAGSQETAIYEIKDWQIRLRQSNQQLGFLLAQVSGVISDSQMVVTQRGEIIRTNAAVYNRLQQLLELISHSVEELGLAAVQIEQVVGSIGEVAEETNLLALNASIEAAGHLEQGRRFTMVASEVYRLALRSRDAAEEVRQVANEIQGSVVSLAKASSQGRYQAQELVQTSRSAPASVEQLTALMETLGRNSGTVLGNIQSLQNSLNQLLSELTEAVDANEPSSFEAQKLIESSQYLRQSLHALSEGDAPVLVASGTGDITQMGGSKPARSSKFSSFQRFYSKFLKSISPNPRLQTARRRQTRLLNKLCLGYCIFLAAYFGMSLFTGFQIISILPSAFFLVLLLLVYSLNKTGSTLYALVGFFVTNFIFYFVYLVSQVNPVETADCIRVGAALFCITIVVSAIIADLGWIFWITILSMAWTTGLAFTYMMASFGDILRVLVYPLSLQAGVGIVAGFLYFNVNQLSIRIEEQNREIALAHRKTQLKKRRIAVLNQQFAGKIAEMRQVFESQARQASLRFDDLTDVSEKVELQALATTQQSVAIRQIGLIITHALEQVKTVVRETDEGQRMLSGFRGGVGEIASNSEDLKIHTGEIGQIFELITAVADEIDLLALNATLEAAQAREAGKRFGAVAGEIQRLAGRARQTGAKVQMVISNVQDAVSLCAQLTERGLNELLVLTQSASETTLSGRTVIEVVGAGQKMVGQLETASLEQADLLGQLTERLREISFTDSGFRPKIQLGFVLLDDLQNLSAKLGQDGQSSDPPVSAEPSVTLEPA